MKTPSETARSLRVTIGKAMQAAAHIEAWKLQYVDINVTAEPGEPELFKERGCNGEEMLALLDAFIIGEAFRYIQGASVVITRVYNNGDRVPKTLPRADAIKEVEYNAYSRPGCAVFVFSVCVQEGYLGRERCAAISEELENPHG